jgi:hypothetical protein
MSIKLRDYILTELDSIDHQAGEISYYYPRYQASSLTPLKDIPKPLLPQAYSTQDAFYEALATGLQLYFEYLSDQWKELPAVTVGTIIIGVIPFPHISPVNCRVNVPPKDLNTIIPGYPTLAGVLKKSMTSDSVDFQPDLFYNGLFDALCVWINSLWTIQVINPIAGSSSKPSEGSIPTPINTQFASIVGIGIILFPASFLMGMPASAVIEAYKADDKFTLWSILSNFIATALFANISTPIPSAGLLGLFPYAGVTIPIPLFDPEFSPSLPPFPKLPGFSVSLPPIPDKPKKPELPAEFPGLPGRADIGFLFTLDFVKVLLGVEIWQLVIDFVKKYLNYTPKYPFKWSDIANAPEVQGMPEDEFVSVDDFKEKIPPIFGDYDLDGFLGIFGITLADFLIDFDIFNNPDILPLPEFETLPVPLVESSTPLLLCSDILLLAGLAAMITLNDPIDETALSAITTGEINGFELSTVLSTCADYADYNGPLTMDNMNLSATTRNNGFTSANNMVESRAVIVGTEYYKYVDMGNKINISIIEPNVLVGKINTINELPYVTR